MHFGPHTDNVECFLEVLREPAVRRRRVQQVQPYRHSPMPAALYTRVRLAGRIHFWDEARTAAARIATPSQRSDAACVAAAIAAADVLPDDVWDYHTPAPLGHLVDRPTGPLTERCSCGTQVGERLIRALAHRQPPRPRIPFGPAPGRDCEHVVPALPTPDAVRLAFELIQRWETPDWDRMLALARRLAR